MTKYMRSRHVPFNEEEFKVVHQEIDELTSHGFESGQLLKTLRENQGWNENELGKKVGLKPEMILMMERGDRSIPLDTAKNFSKLFNVDYHLFL